MTYMPKPTQTGKRIVSASAKQRIAAREIAVNHRSASEAMRIAGYSPQTITKPSNMTRSASFIALMDKIGITDERLSRKLDEGLEATKAVVMGAKSEDSFVDIQPDYAVRHKYLETGLRLKGLGKQEPAVSFQFHVKTDEQRQVYDV